MSDKNTNNHHKDLNGDQDERVPKRAWYQKKRFIIPLAILVLAGVGNTLGDSEPSAPQAEIEVETGTEEESIEPSTSNEDSAVEVKEDEPAEGTFNVLASNFDSNAFPDFEVWIRGSGSWYPDLEAGESLETVGPFEVGAEIEGSFYVYPFGRDGVELPVTIKLEENHISDSPRDLVMISIEEGQLLVSGTPVERVTLDLN